jgi:hypothetical protein
MTAAALAAVNRDRAAAVQDLTFAPNSQLRKLPLGAFSRFSPLKSVCIHATVEIIAARCFTGRGCMGSQIETVTFEPDSRLRTIDRKAFWGCPFMKLFFVPRSVGNMTGGSLPASQRCRIEIEPGNPFFHLKSHFLMDSKDFKLVRYFGSDPEVTIPVSIEVIGDWCFSDYDSIVTVTFDAQCKLSLIEPGAFDGCSSLNSILCRSPWKI